MGEMEEVLEEKKQKKADRLLAFLIGITLISAFLVKQLSGKDYIEFVKSYGLTIMLLFIIFTGISLSKWNEVLVNPGNIWTEIGYTVGLVFILLSIKYPVYNLWFLGSTLIGIMVNEYLGICVQFLLSYLYCGLNGYSIERMLFYFILGAMICFLGKYLYKPSTTVYVTIIVLSCNIIFLFIMNSFIFQNSLNGNTAYSIGSTFAVILILYGIMAFKELGAQTVQTKAVEEEDGDGTACKAEFSKEEAFGKNDGMGKKEELSSKEAPAKEADAMEGKHLSAKELRQREIDLVEPKAEIYDVILNEDHELLKQLQEKSPSLYAHSQRVAELAANGAVILGCSEKIAKAGGLYHEIGRLASKDYIEAGVKLLKDYHFPPEVIAVINQQNSKIEKPKSREAAIVMLSESVVSTVTYFEKEKKKAMESGIEYKEQPLDKIVENIFDIRFSKGALDESGITILEYKKLKHYYMGIYS